MVRRAPSLLCCPRAPPRGEAGGARASTGTGTHRSAGVGRPAAREGRDSGVDALMGHTHHQRAARSRCARAPRCGRARTLYKLSARGLPPFVCQTSDFCHRSRTPSSTYNAVHPHTRSTPLRFSSLLFFLPSPRRTASAHPDSYEPAAPAPARAARQRDLLYRPRRPAPPLRRDRVPERHPSGVQVRDHGAPPEHPDLGARVPSPARRVADTARFSARRRDRSG